MWVPNDYKTPDLEHKCVSTGIVSCYLPLMPETIVNVDTHWSRSLSLSLTGALGTTVSGDGSQSLAQHRADTQAGSRNSKHPRSLERNLERQTSIYTHMPSFVENARRALAMLLFLATSWWDVGREGREEEAWHPSWLAIPQSPLSQPKLQGMASCRRGKSITLKFGHLATLTGDM